VVAPGRVISDVVSGLDWFPTLAIAAGAPADLVDQLKAGMTIGGTEYKVHLDGYNQLALLRGAGPSARDEVWYFAGPVPGAYRLDQFKYYFIEQGNGFDGLTGPVTTPQAMGIANLWLDPFERTLPQNLEQTPAAFQAFFAHEFWRFVYVQQRVAPFAQSFIDFPPQQAPATFNIQAIVDQVKSQVEAHPGN
jgi:arylsulfatase